MDDKEMKRKCFKCGSSPGEDNVKLFRFPIPGKRNLRRCTLWAQFIFPDREYTSVDLQKKLYSEHRMLCQRHFKDEDFTDSSKNLLLRTAVPCDVDSSKHTGVGLKYVYVPMPTLCPMTGLLENVADENENLSSSEEENNQAGSSSEGSSVAAKKTKRSILQKHDNLLDTDEKLMSMKEEEWEVLGKAIGIQLRDLKSKNLTIAQKLISDVIFYAKMGKLSEETHIDLGPDRSSISYLKQYQNRTKLSPPPSRDFDLSPNPSLPSPQYHIEL